ncbi:MAG: DUF445 family protein [Rhizobiaceae bacterium]|nr:DUF445 family protein [Rhizobiaceae bacterium]
MPLSSQSFAGSEGDVLSGLDRKAAALRRTKVAATLALALCVAVLVAARWFESRWPWLSFVAAFAEAATIGGLADWYAVVALFRRPLGLPIPHTAIIPSNRDRIAENLGRFIETNFLAPDPVRRKLEQIDFASLVAEWLSDPARSAGLSRFVSGLLPRLLSTVDDSGLKRFVSDRIGQQLGRIEAAPLAAGVLSAFTEDRRHQKLLDAFLRVAQRFVADETTLATIREGIRKELPTLFNLFRADAYLLKKIVASAGGLIEEVKADPEHPLRREFDLFVEGFVDRLRHSPAYARRAEALKADLLARPEVANLAGNVWDGLRGFVEQDVAQDRSVVAGHLDSLFVDVGKRLAEDERIRADMNKGFVVALEAFVAGQKSGVAAFIADQVRAWDLGQLSRLLEVNIGRDLQYIRFNGMLIGGIAGLVLHTFERLLFH